MDPRPLRCARIMRPICKKDVGVSTQGVWDDLEQRHRFREMIGDNDAAVGHNHAALVPTTRTILSELVIAI